MSKMGRPTLYDEEFKPLVVRLPASLVEWMDGYCRGKGIAKAHLIRELLTKKMELERKLERNKTL